MGKTLQIRAFPLQKCTNMYLLAIHGAGYSSLKIHIHIQFDFVTVAALARGTGFRAERLHCQCIEAAALAVGTASINIATAVKTLGTVVEFSNRNRIRCDIGLAGIQF